MANKTYTFKDFQKEFPTDDVCLEYIRTKKYSERIDCPSCEKNALFHKVNGRKQYACDFCGYQIAPTAGTIFHKSPTPLTIWFYVIYQMAQSLNSISAKQIERETGVTYKTAWRMCTLVRQTLDEGNDPLTGEVEMDESYYGGEEKNKHASKKTKGTQGRSTKTKKAVFGMVERGGTNLVAKIVDNTKGDTLNPIVAQNVEFGTTVYTDEFNAYNKLSWMGYKRQVVPHKQGIFVLGKAHTNTIEGFWSLSKNGIRGTFHAVSDKYLQNYINEYAFKYNHRKDNVALFLTLLSQAVSSEFVPVQ